jgi:tetratricopeptide (TPR) repeat protein
MKCAFPYRFSTRGCIGLALAAMLAAACHRDPHAAMLKFAKSGDEYAAQGKIPEAIVEYRNALEKDPRAGDVRVKLADAYLKRGDAANAVQEYVRAADVLPDAKVQLKAGGLLLMAHRFDDAKVRAEKVLAGDPKNVDAQILLANSLAGLKNLDGAVSQLEEAIQLNPDRSATYTNLGALELGRGRRDEAEKAFRRAVELAPKSASAHLALGSFFWATGRLDAAEQELTGALAVEPDNVLAHRSAAMFYIATNRRDRAEPHLRRVLDLTRSAAAALTLADYYVAQKNESAARQVLQPLADAKGTSAVAGVRLAALDRAGGHSPDAYKRLDALIASEPTNLEAQVLKGSFLLADQKLDEALKIANAVVEAHHDSVAAYYLLGRVQAARKQPDAAIAAYQEVVRLNPLASDAKVALARLQLASGHTNSSVGFAEEALKAQPQNADARLILVRGLIMRGDLDRAEESLKVLRAKYPNSAEVHVQAGMLLGRRKQIAEARGEFEQALRLQPRSLEAVAGLVALDLSARQFDAARARVDALAKAPDANATALGLAARTYAASGDLKTSEDLLRRAVATDPSYLAGYAALGQLYARQGKLDAALTELDSLAQRQPKPVAALTLSGIILEAQGKKAEAQAKLERVLQIDNEAPVAANNLAWMYVENGGNLDVALQLAQTAKRKLPDSAEVNDTLGFIYYKKNLLALAIAPLQLSVQKDPNIPTFHYHLGMVYAKAGNASEARQALTRALALKPDFADAAEARAALETLKGGAS